MPYDKKQQEDINRILGEPELYPPELLSWILKKLSDNPYFTLSQVQLPIPSAQVEVGAPGAPAFASPWAHYDNGWLRARFWRTPWGNCFMNGLIKSTASVSAGTLIFTLPAGYRPEGNILWAQDGSVGGTERHLRVDVNSSGNVVYNDTTGTVGFLGINMFWKAYT